MAKCPNCGKEVSEGFRFCTNCGEKLEPIETAQSVEPAAEAVEEAPVTEPAAETAAEAPMTESAEETVTEPTKEEPASEVPVSAVNEVPVSESAVEVPEEIQAAEPAPEPVSEVPIAPMMEEAVYREPAGAPGNDGQSRETPEEKKKQPPYFLIGVAAVMLLVLISFVALGKVFGGLNPIRLLGVGTPGQKFLGYQADYFNGKMKALEEFGLLRMDDKRALNLTMTGEVRGNKEIAEHLKYSSVVLKTKSNLDKGNLQASLEVYLMGNFQNAYGEYDNGKLSFAFPLIDDKLYTADVKAMLENATGEEVQLPDLKKIKENRKLGKKLLSKYGLLLSKSITKKNLTTEKGTFKIEHLDEDLKDAKYKGTRYTFKPKAEEIEQFVEKLADMMEKDKDLEKFIEQGAYGKYLELISGYGSNESTAEQLSDLAERLRDNAEDIGEELEDKNLTWVVGVEGKTLHEIYLFSDYDDNGEFDLNEEESYVVLASGKDKEEVAEYFTISPNGYSSVVYLWNTYKKKGKTLDGTFTGLLDTINISTTDYTIETGKKYQILPYGEYKLKNVEGDNGKVTLTVKAGKKNSTDCELKMSGLYDLDYHDIRSLTLNINVKEGADISKPKGKTEDITDYSVYELYDLMGEFSSEIENIGEEIFGG